MADALRRSADEFAELGVVAAALPASSRFRSLGCGATDMPAADSPHLVLATFITPPYTGAVAWILLAGPMPAGSPLLYVCDSAEGGAVQHLQLHRPRRRHRALSFPYIFIFTTAALELCRRRWRTPPNILGAARAHHGAGHLAAGAAAILVG